MMQYIIENQNIPLELEPYIKNTLKLHDYFEIRFDVIRPKNYCGFLSINNQSYFIAPKITTIDNTQNKRARIIMKNFVGCVCQRTGNSNNNTNIFSMQIKGALANAPYGGR